MEYNDLGTYRDFVLGLCTTRVKCKEGEELLAKHSIEPHFDRHNYYLFFLEKLDKKVIVIVWDWDKTLAFQQLNELGLINTAPILNKQLLELNAAQEEKFRELLNTIEYKQKWEVEPIYLDGIAKRLQIMKSPMLEKRWNMQSSNAVLNEFTAFCAENLLKNI